MTEPVICKLFLLNHQTKKEDNMATQKRVTPREQVALKVAMEITLVTIATATTTRVVLYRFSAF